MAPNVFRMFLSEISSKRKSPLSSTIFTYGMFTLSRHTSSDQIRMQPEFNYITSMCEPCSGSCRRMHCCLRGLWSCLNQPQTKPPGRMVRLVPQWLCDGPTRSRGRRRFRPPLLTTRRWNLVHLLAHRRSLRHEFGRQRLAAVGARAGSVEQDYLVLPWLSRRRAPLLS